MAKAVAPLQTDQRVESAAVEYAKTAFASHSGDLKRLEAKLSKGLATSAVPGAPKGNPGGGPREPNLSMEFDTPAHFSTSAAKYLINEKMSGDWPCLGLYFFGKCPATADCKRCNGKYKGLGDPAIRKAVNAFLGKFQSKAPKAVQDMLANGKKHRS